MPGRFSPSFMSRRMNRIRFKSSSEKKRFVLRLFGLMSPDRSHTRIVSGCTFRSSKRSRSYREVDRSWLFGLFRVDCNLHDYWCQSGAVAHARRGPLFAKDGARTGGDRQSY